MRRIPSFCCDWELKTEKNNAEEAIDIGITQKLLLVFYSMLLLLSCLEDFVV